MGCCSNLEHTYVTVTRRLLMRAGEVVRLRVNPRDCLSCVDVVRRAGLSMKGMSFAQTVKLALAVLLESARRSNIVPTRDGFEFTEMMREFKDSHSRKLEITEIIEKFGSELHVPAVEASGIPTTPANRARLEAKVRELKSKRDADPDNWSAEEQALLEDVAFQLVELGKGN